MKSLSIGISILLISIFALDNGCLYDAIGLRVDTDSFRRFTYLLVHGSLLHLTINVYSWLVLFFLVGVKWWQLLIATLMSVFLPECVIPCDGFYIVGISTIIYALTGMVIMNSKKWLILVLMNIGLIMFSALLPNTNIAYLPHLYCLCGGLIVGFLTAKRYG